MKYSDYFKQVHNGDEKKAYWALDHDAPAEMWVLYQDACNIVCGDNWTAGIMAEALEELEDNENDIERLTIEADPYYTQLDRWFSEVNGSAALCDEAVEEGLASGKSIYKTIEAGQYLAKERIYRLVHEFLKEVEEAKQNEEEIAHV